MAKTVNAGLSTEAPEEHGVADFLGISSKGHVQAAPSANYAWKGATSEEMQRQADTWGNKGAAQVNMGQGKEFLEGQGMAAQQARQTSLTDHLAQIAAGHDENSAAQAQLKQGQEANLANQLAAARSARGPGASLAGYNAAQAGAQAGAQTSQASAVLRGQEAAQARGELAGVLNQQQSSNLTAAAQQQQLAMHQATLQEQQNQLNQQGALGFQKLGMESAEGQGQLGVAQANNFEAAQEANAATSKFNASEQKEGLGAVFGAAGSAAGAAASIFSDINAKQGIQPAGGQGNASFMGMGQAAPTPGTHVPFSSPQQAFQGYQPQNGTSFSRANVGTQMQQPAMMAPTGPNGAATAAPGPMMSRQAATMKQLPQQAMAPAQAVSNVQQVVPKQQVRMSMPGHAQQSMGGAMLGTQPQQGLAAQGAATGMGSFMSDELTKADVTPAGGNDSSLDSLKAAVKEHGKADTTAAAGGSLAQGAGSLGAGLKSFLGGDRQSASSDPTGPSVFPGYGAPGTGPVSAHDNATMYGKTGGSTGGFSSDKRVKDVDLPGGASTVGDQFLDALTRSQSTYSYKDPRNEPTDRPTGSKYLGIMAQSLEDTPTGDTIVKDGPKGKYLEMGPSLSAALAGLGRLNERLMTVEYALGERSTAKVPKKGRK